MVGGSLRVLRLHLLRFLDGWPCPVFPLVCLLHPKLKSWYIWQSAEINDKFLRITPSKPLIWKIVCLCSILFYPPWYSFRRIIFNIKYYPWTIFQYWISSNAIIYFPDEVEEIEYQNISVDNFVYYNFSTGTNIIEEIIWFNTFGLVYVTISLYSSSSIIQYRLLSMNQIFNILKLTWLYWFYNVFEDYSICHLNSQCSGDNIYLYNNVVLAMTMPI